MADKTHIEWTDATWNPITGCSVVSPGCTNCYAMKLAGTRLQHHPSRAGLTTMSKAGSVWNGQVRFNEQWLDQPLRWRKPRRIFVCAHGDLFHEQVPDEWIDRVFAVMALAPHHTFQVLTKRPERMREYINDRRTGARDKFAPCRNASTIIGEVSRSIDPVPTIQNPRHRRQYDEGGEWHIWMECLENPASERVFATWPLPNVWLGVSAEDQERAVERIPLLLDTPAAVRWVSAEPLLGPVDLTTLCTGHYFIDAMQGIQYHDDPDGVPHYRSLPPSQFPRVGDRAGRIDWVVAGGESGPGARPMHPDWARSLRDQCAAADVAFHFKQWGEWFPEFETPGIPFDDDPEQSRFRTCVWDVETAAWEETRGGWDDDHDWYFADNYADPEQSMTRIGKKNAGRHLDGVTHDAYPAVPTHDPAQRREV